MNHLHETVKKIALLDNNERIKYIREVKWIGYSKAKEIFEKLDDLLEYPRIDRMPNLLVTAETNNGKSVLARRYCYLHKPKLTEDSVKLIVPVVYMEAPPNPEEKRFYNVLLKELNAPFKINDTVDKKQHQAFTILKKLETKMLIIDEIHNILVGSLTKQRTFLNVIRNLANELRIIIVAFGITEAVNAINADQQLSNRFDREKLPLWEDNDDYYRLLTSFESIFPLRKPSYLKEDEIALKILSLSEGTIGEIAKILRLAAIDAINSGTEAITIQIINKIKYTSPSKRKRE
jgi:hypothetical protein